MIGKKWWMILLLLGLVACSGPSELEVNQAIQAAKACETDEDCIDVGGFCPFGCYIVVNKTKEKEIKDLLDSYKNNRGELCQYDCNALEKIMCSPDTKNCTAKVKK